jgi:hypothetical protein
MNKKSAVFQIHPSSAHRDLVCTAAPAFTANIPEPEGSDNDANEGTLAHEAAQLAAQGKPRPGNVLIDDEMWACALEYAGYVRQCAVNKGCTIKFETRVSLEDVIPGCKGTPDCFVIDWVERVIYLIDYKYGLGVSVSAIENWQLMLYLLSIFNEYCSGLEDPNDWRFIATIFQPRMEMTSHWETDYMRLSQFLDFTIGKANDIKTGKTEFKPGHETCFFCRGKAICKARAEWLLSAISGGEITVSEFNPETELVDPEALGPDDYADLLKYVDEIKKWCNQVKEYGLTYHEKINPLPGYKMVLGRGGNRKWIKESEALEVLRNEADESELMEEPKLKSPAQIEGYMKTYYGVKKKEFQERFGQLVYKPEGRPTLAPETDPRPAIGSAAFGEFDNLDSDENLEF